MKAVLIMVLAGVRRRKLQMGVFAAGCFLCSFFLLGVFILKFTMEDSFDKAYEKLNAPDLVVSIQETEVTEEKLEEFLCRLPYVGEYQTGKCYLANHVKLPAVGSGQMEQRDAGAGDIPVRELDFAFLAASEEMKIGEGEVIINNAVSGVGTGDDVEISVNGHTVSLEVVSVVMDAVNSAPETHLPYFWMNGAGLAELAGESGKGSFLIEIKSTGEKAGADEKGEDTEGIKTKTEEEKEGTEKENPEKKNTEKEKKGKEETEKKETGIGGKDGGRREKSEAAEQFARDYESFFGKPLDGDVISYENIRQSYLFRYSLFGQWILYFFLFLFTMVLFMTVLLSRMTVYEDRKKTGILKALGFTGQYIRRIYIWQYLGIAMPACSMGVLVSGALFQGWLGGMFANIDRQLFHINRLWCYQVLAFASIIAILYFIVYVSVRRIGKATPAGKGDGWGGSLNGRRTGLFLPVPEFLPCNLALIKCIGRRAESVFLFVLTSGIALLYLVSFYIIDGVGKADRHLADWGIVEMDIYVSGKTGADEEESGLLAALEQDPAVDFYYAGLSDTVTYRLVGSSLHKNTMGEIYNQEIPAGLTYVFEEGRNPLSYSEAAVGINFAEENGLCIGDRITVVRYGEERELEIVGIYPSFKQYGNSIRFLTDNIQEFFGNRADGYYSVVLADGEDADAFAERMSDMFSDFNFFSDDKEHGTFRTYADAAAGSMHGIVGTDIFFDFVVREKNNGDRM